MAAPNIINTNNAYGRLKVSTVNTTSTILLTNGTNSGNVIKVNTLTFTNANTVSGTATVTLAKPGGNEIKMANTLTVPINSELVVISKDLSIYLEEGDTMNVYANANATITVVCSYEEIS